MAQPLDVFASGCFEGTTALVTGGGTGIGRAVALAFARLGGDVVIASRDLDHLRSAADEITSHGARCLAHPVDIRDTESVDRLRAAAADFGPVDFVINNAGGQFPAPPADITDNGWRAVVDLNLNGTWNMISRFAPQLVEQGHGAIVNIVHIYSFERGGGPFAHSGAARAGVVNLTSTLARTLARANVRINAIAPGTVDTLGMQVNEADVLEELEGMADFLGDVVRLTPMGRLGLPDEVAAGVLFLCSPAGAWVTGTALRIDGGEYGGDWMEVWPGRAW